MTGHLSASVGVWLLIVATQIAAERYGFEPEFTEAMSNVTVPVGRDAVFTCSVANLGGHRVGWVKADTKAIQALHLAVVTLNPRVSVDHVGTTLWKLIIKNVQKEDAGAYMAQINTDPMKFQVAYLDVTEPPDIIDERTPGEVRVRENEPLKLTCEARGNPAPRITWKREDGLDLFISQRDDPASQPSPKSNRTLKNHQHVAPTAQHSFEGEILRITQVSKRHMGIYYCIASNGVPPPVSKRIAVTVLFAPVVAVDNQIVGVPLGTNVTLGCIVESSPKSINVWYKDDKMIANSSRLSYEERGESPSYRVRMVLTIAHFRKSDVGRYDCRCRNELGEAEGTIKLHDLKPLATSTTTSTTTPEPAFVLDDDNDVYPLEEVTTQRTMRTAIATVRDHHGHGQAAGVREHAEPLPANNREQQHQQQSRGTMRPRHDRASSARSATASVMPIVSLLILARAIRLLF